MPRRSSGSAVLLCCAAGALAPAGGAAAEPRPLSAAERRAAEPASPQPPANRAMERWHRLYSGRMAALRRGLGPAIAAVRSGASATLVCAQS